MSISFYALTAAGDLVRHPYGDDDDPMDVALREAGVPFMPNVGAANAVFVLEALGLPTDDCCGDYNGVLPAADFLGRVLLAEAVSPADAGTLTTSDGNFHYCGRSEGYLQRQLGELRTLAEWCVQAGHQVAWA